MNNLIKDARHIPVTDATPTISINPVTLPAPHRSLPLQMRVTAPIAGRDLPIIVLAHGHGPSLYIPSKDGYSPLADFYAARGFVVIQPTFANSKVAGLAIDAPGGPLFWRSRVEDMKLILDQLKAIEAAAGAAVQGRLDHSRIAAVGHSLGGQTVGMLLGARLTDPKEASAKDVNMMDARIKAGVLLAAPGLGDGLSAFAAENYSALNPDFSHMTTPALVVAGDGDMSEHLTVRGPDWRIDPYRHSPGDKCLLTLVGAKHGLGGIAGYDAKETDDEDPDRLAFVQRLTWAYLRSALNAGDPAWTQARKAFDEHARAHGRVACKGR